MCQQPSIALVNVLYECCCDVMTKNDVALSNKWFRTMLSFSFVFEVFTSSECYDINPGVLDIIFFGIAMFFFLLCSGMGLILTKPSRHSPSNVQVCPQCTTSTDMSLRKRTRELSNVQATYAGVKTFGQMLLCIRP